MRTQKSSVKRERHDEKTFFGPTPSKYMIFSSQNWEEGIRGVDLKCDVLFFKVCRFDRSCKS